MAAYQRLSIFFFSGTGNALCASRWIAEHGKRLGLSTQIANMERTSASLTTTEGERTLIGFCYPTHGFSPPWLVIRFMWRFPRLTNADVFFVNTRAGFGLYGFHSGPGLSGVAQWLPILLFTIRGYRVVGSLPLDMPHSWISFFWPNTQYQVSHIILRCERIVGRFCSSVLNGGRYFRWSVWLTLPLDLALVPVTILYLFMGRFFLAKTLFSSFRCDACQVCVKSCPVGAITFRHGHPYWKATCESCMRCMNICPRRAIQSWITRIALVEYGLGMLGMGLYSNGYVWFLVLSVCFFPLYGLVHQLWRIRSINWLFTYTSLTHVWHRYLAPGTRPKDLRQP